MGAIESFTGLRSYDGARLVRGTSAVTASMSPAQAVRGFGAMILDEGSAEWDVPASPDHVLALLQSSRGFIDGKMDGPRFSREIAPWSTNIIPAGLPTWWRNRRGGLNLHVHFDPIELASWFGEQPERARPRPLLDRRDEMVRRCGEAILRELRDPQPGGSMMIEGLALQLGAHLLRAYPDTGVFEVARGGLAPWQLRRVVEYMSDHIADAVSLDDLASVAGLSRFHFARAFKQSTGLPPHAFQIGLRIERAKVLLETTALPVVEIAARVGYGAAQGFTKVFRRETGVGPSDYRRRIRM